MNGTSPHGLHTGKWIREQAGHTDCGFCGARPDKPCACIAGGIHLSRFARAQHADLISLKDFTFMLAGFDVFSGATVIGRDLS